MARIGEMRCLNPECSCQDAAVQETDAGTWKSECHKCGLSLFAKKGSKFKRDLSKLVRLDDADDAPPAAQKPATPPAAPAPARRAGFNLGGL